MSDTVAPWGREIAVEQVGRVPYRMHETPHAAPGIPAGPRLPPGGLV